MIILARDERFLFFPWKWSKGGTIGWFFPIFHCIQPYVFASFCHNQLEFWFRILAVLNWEPKGFWKSDLIITATWLLDFFGFWTQMYFVFVFPHPLFPSIRCILCLSLPNHKMYFVFICLHLLDVFCVRVSPASNHMDFLVEYTPLLVWCVLAIYLRCLRVVLNLKS